VKVLLFVEPDSQRVTVYRRQPLGGFATKEHEGIASVIALPEIEAELPLAELYEGVSQVGALQ